MPTAALAVAAFVRKFRRVSHAVVRSGSASAASSRGSASSHGSVSRAATARAGARTRAAGRGGGVAARSRAQGGYGTVEWPAHSASTRTTFINWSRSRGRWAPLNQLLSVCSGTPLRFASAALVVSCPDLARTSRACASRRLSSPTSVPPPGPGPGSGPPPLPVPVPVPCRNRRASTAGPPRAVTGPMPARSSSEYGRGAAFVQTPPSSDSPPPTRRGSDNRADLPFRVGDRRRLRSSLGPARPVPATGGHRHRHTSGERVTRNG